MNTIYRQVSLKVGSNISLVLKFFMSTRNRKICKKSRDCFGYCTDGGFLGKAQQVKNPPAVQETQVQSLGWEDPLEEGMATHSSLLAWRIPWTEEPGGLQSTGSQRVT